MIIHKDYCSKCKATGVPLLKYTKNTISTGDTVQYYRCRPCNTEKHMKWYYDGNQRKAVRNNLRYQIRKEMNE